MQSNTEGKCKKIDCPCVLFLSQSRSHPLKTKCIRIDGFSIPGTVAINEYSGRSFQNSTGPGPINERVLPYDAAHPDGVPIVFYPTNHISAEISRSVRNNTPQDQSKPQ